MSTIEILRYANIGIQNDEIEISKVLKEEPFRPLKEVKLASGDRIQILFGKKVLDNESNNFIKYPKKVLQVSKETCKTVEDAENRVSFLMENEQQPCSTFRKHHTWQIFETIDFKDKWLVFLV